MRTVCAHVMKQKKKKEKRKKQCVYRVHSKRCEYLCTHRGYYDNNTRFPFHDLPPTFTIFL